MGHAKSATLVARRVGVLDLKAVPITSDLTNTKPGDRIPGLSTFMTSEDIKSCTFVQALEIPKPRPASLGFGYHEQRHRSRGAKRNSPPFHKNTLCGVFPGVELSDGISSMRKAQKVYDMSPLGDELRKISAWQKAAAVSGYDSNQIRRDQFGSFIMYSEYGKTSEYGWEIDHGWPSSLGGSDHPANLCAMHWLNNRKKSNKTGFGLLGY